MYVHHRLTGRSFLAGSILAVILCAVNSYLTLSFGIMEEGPAIAALFFFAVCSLLRSRVTIAEMVIVATMGSAGGCLGFISNFFAAQTMVVAQQGGVPYSILQMWAFAVVTSLIGLASAIILRQILVVQNDGLPRDQQLPWVGAKAVKGVIDPLVDEGDEDQPRYLLFFTLAAILYVVFNSSGVGWFPELGLLTVGGLSAYGAGVAFSPFVWGGAYLMGMRTCVGFLLGGVTLLLIAPHLPAPGTAARFMPTSASPQAYVWPGVVFLVTSGITALLLQWNVIVDAIRSLAHPWMREDRYPIMSGRGTAVFIALAVAATIVTLLAFHLPLLIILAMIAVGGLVLNLIATRAAAQTYFNPARVMGILLMGVNALLGGSNVATNLTGAGFVAGSGAQSGNLTNDFAYGFWYRIRSAWQFWTQASTVLVCALVSAVTFALIRANFPLQLQGEGLPAPVAKIWATMALLFDPQSTIQLPPFAVGAMWLGGVAGVLWALLESREGIRRFLPGSIGFGLGLILPVFYDIGFFCGGLMMFVVLRRFLRISDLTLNTIAIACIVGEGVGGILQAVLKIAGVIAPH